MYPILLVPLDGSERAESILPHVEYMALHFKSKVILLRVWTIHDAIAQVDTSGDYILNYSEKKEQMGKYLDGIQERLQKNGIESAWFVEMGDAVDTILSVAQRENASLIAIASHGRSGMSRVFYGSVTAGVMQKIDRPILVIRTRKYLSSAETR